MTRSGDNLHDGPRAGGDAERDRLIRALRGLGQAAREAGLTGQLAEGREVAIRQYNAILTRLQAAGDAPVDLFQPLPESASFDSAGLSAIQLLTYLQDEDEERRRRRRERDGDFPPVGAVGQAIQDQFCELGDLLREHMPDSLRARVDAFRDYGRRAGGENAADPAAALRREMEEVLALLRRPAERAGQAAHAQRLADLAAEHLRLVSPGEPHREPEAEI